ncbi:hypothetical protein F5X68DRAFT_252125 [Plectosphaerella plurivora]|uniref:Uncharacterized protein n=1 Tax=Plectosphaerella plurivora TaxID=936078 RepID=A0A9P9A378_9PEZI|nr:hypothetical protein F5X68DRAFT_252125 [Plectosphaerella plurivora]
MEPCLCHSIRQLARDHDESRVAGLITAINDHLSDLRTLLGQSKTLARDVRYRITPNNPRTSKVFDVDSVDSTAVSGLVHEFGTNPEAFWAATSPVHPDLRRRVATVVVFLLSKIDPGSPLPPQIAGLFKGSQPHQETRLLGKKYVSIARKLVDLGAILWLPTSIPPSTCLAPRAGQYTDFLRRLVLSQLRESSSSHYNLFPDNSDFLPISDKLTLLFAALGGCDIPDPVLRSVRLPQRRWNAEGEMENKNAIEFGLPTDIVQLLSTDDALEQMERTSLITKGVLDDGTVTWSLSQEMAAYLSQAILPSTRDQIGQVAVKLACFSCPPCYEGDVSWSASLKRALWPIFMRALQAFNIEASFRIPTIEAVLYFCERDSVDIRHLALEEAKGLLRKSMPYYLHASVTLFRSVLHRLDGDFVKSEAVIRDFTFRGPRPETRRDRALLGWLHISQVDNKIRCYDNDVSSYIYKWSAEQPFAAARFFQSIGEFGMARASLEQFMALNSESRPLRPTTRQLLVCRLADVYCEMGEHSMAMDIVGPELDSVIASDRPRRVVRRLLLALAEANIGLERLDAAEELLAEARCVMPETPHDLWDEQLHMRMFITAARIVHMRPGVNPAEAVSSWRSALEEVGRMSTLKARGGFTAAMVYLSMAHAQLAANDRDGARVSWATGTQILTTELCEFFIPIAPTKWLHQIATEVRELQGWSCRVKLPGGRQDLTWS